MDTNRNDGQNYQINAFNKGMNTDTALDAVGEGQYIFGQNIRISNNVLLADNNVRPNIDPNSKEGLVTPITIGQETTLISLENVDRILATGSIGNVGVVIFRYKANTDPVQYKWKVYRVVKNYNGLTPTLLYESKSTTTKDKFSIVLNKEQENIIKLYIADGDHGIMQLFVEGGTNPNYTDDDLVSGKYFPSDKAIINGTVSGKLKTQQVQYTYRFYKRYGIFSKLAPLTNKIQIINSNRDTEQGNAENTTTTIGISLSIPLNNQIHNMFDHLQLIRVSYVVAGQVPEISIVKDVMLKPGDAFDIVDTGEDALQELSLDEFAALNTQTLIPKVIEQNQGYMFAANVKDDTVFTVGNDISLQLDVAISNIVVESENQIDNIDRPIFSYSPPSSNNSPGTNQIQENFSLAVPTIDDQYGGGGSHTDTNSQEDANAEQIAQFIADLTTTVNGAIQNTISNVYDVVSTIDQVINNIKTTHGYDFSGNETGFCIQNYLQSCGIGINNCGSYDDMFMSSMCRSLKRGETYLYGLVLYKKDGTHSDVICQQEITIPTEKTIPSWYYDNSTNTLFALPIGIHATVTIPNTYTDIIGYEVVRCEKTPATSKILLTSILSRPVSEPLGDNKYTPAYPQYILNTSNTELHNSVSENDADQVLSDIILYSATEAKFLVKPLSLLSESDMVGFTNNINSIIDGVSYAQITNITLEDFADVVFNAIENESSYSGLTSVIQSIQDEVNRKNKLLFVSNTNSAIRVAQTQHTQDLVQIFSPEILFRRRDILNVLSNSMLSMSPVYYTANAMFYSDTTSTNADPIQLFPEHIPTQNYKDKPTTCGVFDYTQLYELEDGVSTIQIKRIKDVKNALWYSGFSQIDTNSSDSRIVNGVKQYKTYNTSIGQYEYVNWVCNGLYDLPISAEEAKSDVRFADISSDDTKAGFRVYNDAVHYDFKTNFNPNNNTEQYPKNPIVHAPIGPGPICFLAELSGNGSSFSYALESENSPVRYFPTAIVVNIINNSFDGYTDDQKLYTPYYGFGNYHALPQAVEGSNDRVGKAIVFDGDVYTTMCEFVTMFKAYDFKSLNDNIISNQYICRVPMESAVNTYFDYGMNYRNTQNKNLQLEPGSITNVTTQDRPLHQYNQIYSDNNTSVSVYTAQPLESRTNQFPQRICYSQHKDNGEQIDSWNIFKPVDYIDADTRYGEVTNLLSANDTIFFWQDRAFGKLSVNERSLITDNNSNTIQLGQGGVLQRTDYLSTKYGMRTEDYSAINTENGLFWIDILNKAVVANTQNGVINYGEMLNVQNLINKNIKTDVPEIDYDLQNSELLCKCFGDNQLIFNTKYNIATAIYSRPYNKMLYFNNVLYGLNKVIKYRQFNYLTTGCSELLSPTVLQFVVNNSPSQTKVFDNQKIVVAAKNWSTPYTQRLEFKTDANAGTSNVSLGWLLDNQQLPLGRVTNREHNICYTIPRESGEDPNYKVTPQLRMRGKWMTVKITDAIPKQDFAISHIITKFRQSYS